MDKAKLKQIRKDIDAALKSVQEKHDVVFEIGRITYDSTSFRAKLKGTEISGDGKNPMVEAERVKFEKHAALFGFDNSDFQKEFNVYGEVYELRGFKPRATKYPIVALKKSNGKMYKFPKEAVKI